MHFYIDADSFPALCRDIICRAALKRQIPAVFVARSRPPLPKSRLISFVAATAGPDAADDLIVDLATSADLVFTRDIPLAARLVAKGVLVLNDRGTVYTGDNIGPRLSQRDLMADLRDAGIAGMGGRSYSQRELLEFANAFDRILTKRAMPPSAGPSSRT